MALVDDLKKYEGYVTDLKSASIDVASFKDKIIDLKSSVINNIKINYKGLDEDIIQAAISDLDSSISTINNNYVPTLNRKIEETKQAIAKEEADKKAKEEEEKKAKEKASSSDTVTPVVSSN